LNGSELTCPGGYGGVPQYRRARQARSNLLEQLQPFSAQAVLKLHEAGGIAAGTRKTIDEAGTDWVGDTHEHDGDCARCLQQRRHGRGAGSQNDVRGELHQFRCVSANAVGIAYGPAIIDPQIPVVAPAQLPQHVQESRHPTLHVWIVWGVATCNHTYPSHPVALLRARRERPRGRGAADQGDELPPFHSITSSARASSVAGISRPSILAVTALMTNSNLLDCTTGRSAGLASLRMRPA
jgi:hypothetical protein